jgi:hypothetical protein
MSDPKNLGLTVDQAQGSLGLANKPDPKDLGLVVSHAQYSVGLASDCASKVSLSLLFYICIYCFYLGFL